MTVALLNCIDEWEEDHLRPCVTSLACWWREIGELEILLGYHGSTMAACRAWNDILASEILSPCEALYAELRACVGQWRRIATEQEPVHPSLLDGLLWTAMADDLPLPKYALLAAFRLRQRLCEIQSNDSSNRETAAWAGEGNLWQLSKCLELACNRK